VIFLHKFIYCDIGVAVVSVVKCRCSVVKRLNIRVETKATANRGEKRK